MARVLKVTNDCAFLIRRGLSWSLSDGAKPPAEGVSKLKQAGRTINHVKVPNAKDDVKEYSVLEDEEFQKKRLSPMELEIDELKRDLANWKSTNDLASNKVYEATNGVYQVSNKVDQVSRKVDEKYAEVQDRIGRMRSKTIKYLIVGAIIYYFLFK